LSCSAPGTAWSCCWTRCAANAGTGSGSPWTATPWPSRQPTSRSPTRPGSRSPRRTGAVIIAASTVSWPSCKDSEPDRTHGKHAGRLNRIQGKGTMATDNDVKVTAQKALGILQDRGWCQGQYVSSDGRVCLTEAWGIAQGDRLVRHNIRPLREMIGALYPG